MAAATILLTALAALAVVNMLTFYQFGDDKRRALAGERRIRESELLWLAFLGGTPAAYAARRRFRHKTRKQPFSDQLAAVAMVQAGILAGLTIEVV